MFHSLLFPASPGLRASVGLLAIRVVAGAAFMFHGWPKIKAPMSWMGPDPEFPAVLLALAAVSEFCGGAAWILGALTPLASFGIGCTMGFAVMHHLKAGDPFVGRGASWELASVYLAVALVLLSVGPGSFAADSILFRKKSGK